MLLSMQNEPQKTVVSIEDDPAIAELLKFVLAAPQLRVTQCRDGVEGLAAVCRVQPHLVVMDVMLPLMNGWQVYDAIRADEVVKNTPVLMLSVTRQELERQRAFRASAIDFYMNKPFDPRTLRRLVEEILGIPIWNPDPAQSKRE
jgi:DNA-binding response OmpR family regulator